MGALALLVTAILATLVLYFWARKAQLERRLSHLKQQKKNTPALGVDVLDRLCQQYYVYEGTDNLQPRIVKEVRAVVEGLRTDAAMQRSLEQALNEQNNQVMEKLRAFFPRWKEEDFLLYLFTASGFSSTTLSTLLEKDKPYIYNHLYRLKERIKVSGSPDRDLFLACLER